jgi:hypothetical protein
MKFKSQMSLHQFSLVFSFIAFFSSAVHGQSDPVLAKLNTLLLEAQKNDRSSFEIYDAVKKQRIRLEEELLDAKENPKLLTKQAKKETEKKLKIILSQEQLALDKRKLAAETLSKTTEILTKPAKAQAKYIEAYEKKNGVVAIKQSTSTQNMGAEPIVSGNNIQVQEGIILESEPLDMSETNPVVEGSKPKKNPETKTRSQGGGKVSKPTDLTYKKYNIEEDLAFSPPAPECRITFDGIDNFTGKKKRETAFVPFFNHTEEYMRNAMGYDKDFIESEISLSRIQGGFLYLNITIFIRSKDAQRSFGFIDKNSPIALRFVNNKTLSLLNTKTDIGMVDMTNNFTTFKMQTQLTNSDVEAILKTELDAIRIAWSAGYEDYEILNLDVLQNLIKCLEKR